MKGEYVPIEELSKNPEHYKEKWIQSIARLSSNPYHTYSQGGPKFSLNIESKNQQKITISIWEKVPFWLEKNYSKTSQDLISIFSGADEESLNLSRLFNAGEEVFFEGYAKFSNDILFINIENILIADPSTAIGPREIVEAMVCPRAYYLGYVKNISSSLLKKPNKNSSRGNIVHTLSERIISTGDFFKIHKTANQLRDITIRNLIKSETETTYKIDSALHLLARTPLESVQADSYYHLMNFFYDDEVSQFIEGKRIGIEKSINILYGLSGTSDFIINDTIPMELKTAKNIYQDHITQLKVYILESYFESGNRIGYLLNTNRVTMPGSNEERHIHEITLTDEDIRQILHYRHKVLLLRKGLSLPTTVGRECSGCRYCESSYNPLQAIYPSCQFYCQTERYWDCCESSDTEPVSNPCKLFDSCPVKNLFFDPELIDHFNQLRKGILIENLELGSLSKQLRSLPYETLRACGQIVQNLTFTRKDDNQYLFSSLESIPCLDLIPGDGVIISTSNNRFRYLGTFIKNSPNNIWIHCDGFLHPDFFKSNCYTLEKDYSGKQMLRYLLKALDYTQRSLNNLSLFKPSRKKINETRILKPYSAKSVASDLSKLRTVAIQTSCQDSDAKKSSDIIAILPRPSKTLLIMQNSAEIEDFIATYSKLDDILIIDRDENFLPHPRQFEIGQEDNPIVIAEKLSRVSVIITEQGFLNRSHIFEFLKIPERKVFFDYIVATNAEKIFEPLFLYIRSLGYHTLLMGDAHRISYPVRNKVARSLGLANGPFEKLVLYDSYFDSDEYSIFIEPFQALPKVIIETLRKGEMDIQTKSFNGSIQFIDVPGIESEHNYVRIQRILKMGDTPLQYQLSLESCQSLDANNIDTILTLLKKYIVTTLEASSIIHIGEFRFRVVDKIAIGNIPESGENVKLTLLIPVKFSETLQELLYSNEEEVIAVVKFLKELNSSDQKNTVILTPFVSQASNIQEALSKNGMHHVPVMLPLHVSGHCYKNAIISLVSANDSLITRYPLTDPKTLYTILTIATEKLVIIGRKNMVKQNRILSDVISSTNTIIQ
jgi:CRISPR/Cas system-associated exonuclease Cas4 (RecB family)